MSRNLHLLPDPITGEPGWVASCADCGVELAVGDLDEQGRTERRGSRRCPECGSAVAWRLPGVTRLHRDLVAAGVVSAEGDAPGRFIGGRRPMLTREAACRRWVPATAAVPLGPANGDVDFFARGSCAQPGVDPAVFTSEEDDQDSVAAARAVCSGCPVRLACRLYAYEANPYGVYAGETRSERVAKLQLRARLAADERDGETPCA